MTSVLIAQCVGLTSTAIITGYIGSYSQASVAALLRFPNSVISPSVKSKIWAQLWTIGANTSPYMSLVSAAAFAYLAYNKMAGTEEGVNNTVGWSYATAALLAVSIAPYTILAMGDINGRLHARANAEVIKEDDGDAVDSMLEEWTAWNTGRAMLPLLSCLLGWWASLQ